MFRAFNLKAHWSTPPQQLYKSGLALKTANAAKIRATFQTFLDGDGTLDASQIQAEWFPQISAQVFISHSHQDEKIALTLAGWLSRLGLNAFIDSCVWGHADLLLKKIDNAFCRNSDRITYCYSSRNRSTSHVHMMLATALAKMIDRTECVLFLNTPNSINSKEAVDRTKSPWIFSEMATFQIIRRRKKESHREQVKFAERVAKNETRASFRPMYTLDMTSLTVLNSKQMKEWDRIWRSEFPKRHALDVLYELVPG